jgi:drug/metabolite transporter (DMT)-like permease
MSPPVVLSLLVLAVLWGSAFPLIKVGLEGLTVPHLTLARHLVASLAFVPFLVVTGGRRLPDRRDVPLFFLLGLLGVTVYHLALNYGELRVSAGAASLIIASAPAITAIVARFLAGEHFPPLGWLGSALSFAGVGLIVIGDGAQLGLNPSALLILLSALVTALFFVLQKPVLRRYRAVEVTAFATWAGTVPLLAFLPGFGADVAGAGAAPLLAAVYIGIFPSALAYTIFAYALSKAPASLVTVYLYTVPIFSLLFAWLVLGEVPTWLTLVGGTVVVVGIVVVNRSRGGRGIDPSAVGASR